MRRLTLALLTLLLAAVAAPALAAPARETVLTSAQPYTWEGGPATGAMDPNIAVGGLFRCTPVYECEDTLVETKETGDLAVQIKAGAGSTDLDVAIFESDSEGTVNADSPAVVEPQEPKAEDISTGADAKATARKLPPGFYVIRVRFYQAEEGVYTGTATLVPPPTAVEPPPAATPPAPAPPASTKSSSAKKKRAACTKKAKKIKNAKKRKAAMKKCRRKRS